MLAHHFANPVIERKDVIARYLQLIMHSSVGEDAFIRRQAGSLLDRILLTEYLDLLAFLERWDCDNSLAVCHTMHDLGVLLIRAALDGRLDPLDIFVLGAEADYKEVCPMAIRAGCFADRVLDPKSGAYLRQVWDVEQLPQRFVATCHPDYVEAVTQAMGEFHNVSRATPGGQQLPVEYLEGLFCRYLEVPIDE